MTILLTVSEILMLICLVSGMGECFAVLVFSFVLAELVVQEAVSLLHLY